MAKLDKQIERVDQLCEEIAKLELDNWDVIERFRAINAQIEVRYQELKKYCDNKVIFKKITDIKDRAGRPRKQRRGGVLVKQRLKGFEKYQLTKHMVADFVKQKLEKVSLDDINNWLDAQANEDPNDDVRDRLLIRGIKIPQVNWFHIRTKINGKERIIKLYDAKVYESKQAPYKSYFNVRAWHKFLMTGKELRQIPSDRNTKTHEK